MTQPDKARARNQVIDGFRGVAVLSVMAFHYLHSWSRQLGYRDDYGGWFSVGQLGVDLFFVISGLVITMTMLRCSDAMEFLVRRFARLYPAFIVAASLIFALLALSDPMGRNVAISDYIANWTMMAGELGFRNVDGVFWTLAIELKFYVFVAIAFVVLGRKRVWLALVAIALVGSAVSILDGFVADHVFIARYMPFFLLGTGVWYGIVERDWRACVALTAASALTFAIQFQVNSPKDVPVWLAQCYLAATIGVMIAMLKYAPAMRLGPLAWIGRISYSLYLVHQSVGITIIALLMARGWLQELAIAAACVVSVALAWLMFNFVELPGQRLVMERYGRIRERLSIAAPGLMTPSSESQSRIS